MSLASTMTERAERLLDAVPRLPWTSGPSPVVELSALAREVSAAWLGVKRDDLLDPEPGGTKVRKLEVLLASRALLSATRWTSVGAIGSGHLVALAAAAQRLDKELDVEVFWQPLSPHIEENLAFTSTLAHKLRFHGDRYALALSRPSLFLSKTARGAAVVPAGATTPATILGVARGAVEVARQIERGELPVPDEVIVPLGTGGTAVGLALGLALLDAPTRVRAVAVVEPWFTSRWYLTRLADAASRELRTLSGDDFDPGSLSSRALARLVVDGGQRGPGYGRSCPESLQASSVAAAHGLELEPVYSAKAFAALLEVARASPERRLLFWATPRKSGPLPHDPRWREKLPARLAEALERGRGPKTTRRRFVLVGATAALALAAGVRTSGYPEAVDGARTFAPWEIAVLEAAALALVEGASSELPRQCALALDRFVGTLPDDGRLEIHALLLAVEQGTLVAGSLSRFTQLTLGGRREVLASLARRKGPPGLLYRGLRDLVMAGTYQLPSTWGAIGYGGPLVEEAPRASRYDALVGDVADLQGLAA